MTQSTAVVPAESPRKRQLVLVAGQLFQEHGFHKVSMADVAREVGLRGPALYRHFRSKQELLARVVLEQITVCVEVAERAAGLEGSPRARLDQMIDELGKLVLDRNEVMLWRWERRHLAADDQHRFREHARALEATTASLLRGVRPELSESDAELLSWAFLSTFAHTRSFRSRTDAANDRQRSLAVLSRMAGAVVAARITSSTEHAEPQEPRPFHPSGRRERVIEAATELFNDRGFVAVSIEDISAASDTAIATIYQYFESKSNLLYTILDRGIEGLNYLTVHLLWSVSAPEQAIDALVTNYVNLSLGPHGRLFRIFDEELVALTEQQQAELLRSQRGHTDEWVGALQRLRSPLPVLEARAMARTAAGVASDIAQTAKLLGRPSVRDDMVAILHAIVHS